MRMRHADVDVVEARLVDDGKIVTGGEGQDIRNWKPGEEAPAARPIGSR
jgi:hypothetical protein